MYESSIGLLYNYTEISFSNKSFYVYVFIVQILHKIIELLVLESGDTSEVRDLMQNDVFRCRQSSCFIKTRI